MFGSLDSNNDHITPRHSTAARESTEEVPCPEHHGKEYYEQMALILQDHSGPQHSLCSMQATHQDGHIIRLEHRDMVPENTAAGQVHLDELFHSCALLETPHELHAQCTTGIYAGLVEKLFHIHTALLVQTSPFFASLTDPGKVMSAEIVKLQSGHNEATTISGPFYFPDLDEYAFALFVRWIYGGQLHGPNDFHSMNHYLCLYVLAQRFEIEAVQNTVMDLIRGYYHRESMTAPAFRLEYIYRYTEKACLMREFLVDTAAYRALSISEKFGGLSDSMRNVLRKDGEIAPDFANSLVSIARKEREDARKGDPCKWHEHYQTPKCPKWAGYEPFEAPS